MTTMDNLIEEPFKKIENEELLRIFPINTVVGTRKFTEENKDRKRFSFLLNKHFLNKSFLLLAVCPCT